MKHIPFVKKTFSNGLNLGIYYLGYMMYGVLDRHFCGVIKWSNSELGHKKYNILLGLGSKGLGKCKHKVHLFSFFLLYILADIHIQVCGIDDEFRTNNANK